MTVGRTAGVSEDVQKLEFFCSVHGKQNGAASVENSAAFPQNIKNRTTIQSSNFIPGYLSKGKETIIQQVLHPYAHFSVTYNSQDMKAI